MKDISLVYGIQKVSVSVMLYVNAKSMVRSLDGDTDFSNIKSGILQGYTLAPSLFEVCLDYVMK